MKAVNIFVSLAIAMLLGACATSGNVKMKDQTQSSVAQQIVEEKTTKAEIVQAFGQATTVSFTDAGNEVWTYKHSRDVSHVRNFIPYVNMISSGADTTTKELVIMFNKNDVVSKYTMREIQGTANQGIIH
jgi:outer membrane protein assembly factor BamE (lipoprotein component of BamABCDE complex)